MKRLILSLLAVCLLWMANAQNPAWGPQSKVVTDSIYSQVLKAHRAYTIYLPQSYSNETDRKYPILYLLHGMSGVNTSWFTDQRVKDVMDQLVASGEACEMIIVSPNAGGNPAHGTGKGYRHYASLGKTLYYGPAESHHLRNPQTTVLYEAVPYAHHLPQPHT